MNDDAQKAKERFLDSMHEDAIKVRPKWRFTLRTIFLVTGIFLAALFLLYLVSFIIFILHQTGTWFGPEFGGPGWFALFRSLPWLLILLCVIFGAALFLLAAQDLGLDLERSWLVGDRWRDVSPALSLGARGILLIGRDTPDVDRSHHVPGITQASQWGDVVDVIHSTQ